VSSTQQFCLATGAAPGRAVRGSGVDLWKEKKSRNSQDIRSK
jgi:hypothetical protein